MKIQALPSGGPTFAGTVAAPAVDVAPASTIESGAGVLGPTSGGAAATFTIGGGVASTVDVGRAPTVPAVRGVPGRLRGGALEALAVEGGVGGERVPVALGSVIFENRGDHGKSARLYVSLGALSRNWYIGRTGIQLNIANVRNVPILTGGADTARSTASVRTHSWICRLTHGSPRWIA